MELLTGQGSVAAHWYTCTMSEPAPSDKTKTSPPQAKKTKMSLPEAKDEDWPTAWLMVDDDQVKDQCLPNQREPNVPVSAQAMRDLGIHYWKLDAEAYEYPIKAIPWDPKDAVDPQLAALRDDRGYNYADIITIHPDHLPEFEKKIAAFFEEHIHDAEEIRYILGGSGTWLWIVFVDCGFVLYILVGCPTARHSTNRSLFF